MSQAGNVIKDRVRGHLDDAFPIGPTQILRRLMIKHIGYKNALLTVTDRAGHSTVIAVNAVGQIGRELFNICCCLACLREHLIPISNPIGH